MFQFGERRNCTIFRKIGTKLRQKLKYSNQIENEKMASGIIVTRGTVTVTWHDVSLTRGKFVILLKKLKKNNKKIKKIIKYSKI